MKKVFISFFCMIFIIGSLSGCHGAKQSKGFDIPENFDESKKVEISFWAKNDTNVVQTAIYNKAIEDFQKLYPNITVNMRLYTDYGKIYNDVITNISTGTTPNVCITYPDHIATYLTGNDTVVPLDDLFASEKYGLGGSELKFDSPSVSEVVPQFLDECVIGDKHYAIPYMRSTEACYINKTYVEKLGFTLPETLTWDFIWQVSEKAMEKNADGTFKVNGQNVLIPFIYKSTDNMMIQSLKQLGAGYSDSEGNALLFNDDTRKILKTVAQYTKEGAFSTFKISGYPANFLNAGQCIFAIDSTAGATWMGSDAPLVDIAEEKLVKFETEVMPIPQYDTEHPKMISQGPSICVFNKSDSQEVLASWIFAQYLLTNEVQIAYSETEGYVPVTTKAQRAEEYQDYLEKEGTDTDTHYEVKIKAAKLLMDNTENTFITPVFNGSASVRDAAGQMIENVTKAVRRKKTVDDAFIDALYKDVQALYHLDQQGTGIGQGKNDLGPLPLPSVILLCMLVITWVLIGIYVAFEKIKEKNKN
ncbi:ABC transporter substrate-binding protein [Butyrivibrio sp. YAB3001]|uniref:ABC transporter substrate-binding protein n=1 Tax=Butyrivibrio sp. YAB3001 TaxID=1520812 RepID=UPI0008F66C31|nr:extracellular solute-binding protein [Butyrivibrio sp. YAB3001]SFC19721.1 multiple sugar transport system substrate-binding protein [Butyrivibrio sp. YAB3001]